MWRLLNQAFGVLEAPNADLARKWIAERPDIDALIVEDELPDTRGGELVRELADRAHPIAARSIVVASEWRRMMLAPGLTVVERGDAKTIVDKLTSWFIAREIARRPTSRPS
jgi:hypothetical protein